MKVENWGDITCHECKRKLVHLKYLDGGKEALMSHPQNTIGSVTYGWIKCSNEGKQIVVPVPLIDVTVVKNEPK